MKAMIVRACAATTAALLCALMAPTVSSAAPSASEDGSGGGASLVSRQLTLTHTGGEFRGGIYPAVCLTSETRVEVYRERAGRDRRIGRVRADDVGSFVLDRRPGNGTFYARLRAERVSSVGTCTAARSNRVEMF